MKILITLQGDHVAPRFDLCTEVLIATSDEQGKIRGEPRTMLLPGPSSDELCNLIIREEISLVICGGIEETHFQYLVWKKITVIDRIIGSREKVLDLALANRLQTGSIFTEREAGAAHE
jgi:predicted Fe-Mo cluster-binding NifX family protein